MKNTLNNEVDNLTHHGSQSPRHPGVCFMDPLQSGHGIRNGGHAWAPQHGPALTKEQSSLTVPKDKNESLQHSLREQLLVCPSWKRQHLSTQGQTHSGTYLPSLSSGLLLASCFMNYRLLYPWLSIKPHL